MKKLHKLIVLAGIAVLAFMGCASPFFFGAADLAGKTLTFFTSMFSGPGVPNGHDYITLTFDTSGKAGSFEVASFSLGYATQAAQTSGTYTDETWFQTDGTKGTFTYDPKTSEYIETVEQGYSPAPGAAQLTGGGYAASSYAYRDYKDYVTFSAGLTVTSASMTLSANAQVSQDNIYQVYLPGSADNSWVQNVGMSLSFTIAGVTTTNTTNTTDTLTVTAAAYTTDSLMVSTQTVGTGTPSKTTTHTGETFTVNKYFIVGKQDKADATWADVWKKNNTVSFQCERTHWWQMIYTGDTAPTLPTADATTGQASTSGATWSCQVDDRPTTDAYTYTHGGDFIYSTDQTLYAGRTISR